MNLKPRLLPILIGAGLAAAFVLFTACGGGGDDDKVACSDTPLPEPEVWQTTVAAMNESIRLADSGDGEGAVDTFFTGTHDTLHLIGAGLCRKDYDASRAISAALDDLHFKFDPEDPVELKALLTAIRDEVVAAAEGQGIKTS